MIIMKLKANNLFCFKDFEVDFTYPMRLKKSTIDYEYLEDYPNFRFKKVNIIMGCNASGKTAFGKLLMGIFNFISNKNINLFSGYVSDSSKEAEFEIDMVFDNKLKEERIYKLYRLKCVFKKEEDKVKILDIVLKSSLIGKKDSYEKAANKLKVVSSYKEEETENEDGEKTKINNSYEILDNITNLGWFFCFPSAEINETEKYNLEVLKIILKTLDDSIEDVKKVEDADNGFLIYFENGRNVLMQNGKPLREGLSSGTSEGIGIAYAISSMLSFPYRPFYIDEKFSHVHTEIEKTILNIMVELIGKESQLFFTTHNTDLLKMDYPTHSFFFFSKNENETKVVKAESLLNKNDRTLIKYVEDNVFDTIPDTGTLYDLLEGVKNE